MTQPKDLLSVGVFANLTRLSISWDLAAASDRPADGIQKNGFETARPPREVWHTEPGVDAKWEIVWLFK